METRYLPDTVYGHKVNGGIVFTVCVTAIQGHYTYGRITNWYLWTYGKTLEGLLHIGGFLPPDRCVRVKIRKEAVYGGKES
jgi:hypothetical protein